MRVLSIKQPWAYLIANGIKDIENRDWNTSYRGPVLLHAGKQKDRDCFLYDHGATGETLDPRIPWTNDDRVPQWDYLYRYGGVIGIATLVDVVTQSTSTWFRGTYGFVFKDARLVTFFALRGLPSLFEVPTQLLPQEVKDLVKV